MGNGFALDDNWFILENEVVTEGLYAEAFTRPAWPGATEGTGNYRPVTLSSLAAEWAVWGPAPLGYHLVNVLAHAGVCLLVLLLLAHFVPLGAATVGAALFAVHPVHVEAVANVMGRAELYAAAGYLGACVVYLKGVGDHPAARAGRLVALLALFALAVGSKEMAVTLPAMLVVLEVMRRDGRPLAARLTRELPTYVAAFGLAALYVLVRSNVVGDLTGRGAAAGLLSLDTTGRLLSALTVWPEYLRLLLFPVDLSADYSPGVLVPTTVVTPLVLLGGTLLLGTLLGAIALRGVDRTLALCFAWFAVAILPVSNLIVRADVLLAERTLYLPSVALSFGVAALALRVWALAGTRVTHRRAALGVTVVVTALLMGRTVARNPAWLDTFTVLNTLAVEHPESWMSQRALAVGFERVRDDAAAERAWEAALTLAPDHYQVLVEAALFFDRTGRFDRAEQLFGAAIELMPERPEAHARLAERRIVRGDGRGGHAAALRGIALVGSNRDLWAMVSESYVMKADLPAALRARRASVAAQSTAAGWARLAELLDALGRPDEAAVARDNASRLAAGGASG